MKLPQLFYFDQPSSSIHQVNELEYVGYYFVFYKLPQKFAKINYHILFIDQKLMILLFLKKSLLHLQVCNL